MRKVKYEPIVEVFCTQCNEWKDEGRVKFLDISEDVQGRDVEVFECPDCHTKQESLRVSK